jgi:hypothetical protein
MAAATSSPKKPAEVRCNICGRTFASTSLLEAHVRVDHSSNSSPPAGVS